MKLPGRKNNDDDNASTDDRVASAAAAPSGASNPPGTAPKGRPTPKRNEANRRRGPVTPAPMTAAEARARRKALAGPKLSRAERRASKAERRERIADRREHMMSGDEAYLTPRDRGPIRRYARDITDARYNVLGLFMPSALGLLFVMMTLPPQWQPYVSMGLMVLMVVMAADGVLLGRKVVRMVDAKFPDNTESRLKLGFYAAGRASQLRRTRAPRPQVQRGERID